MDAATDSRVANVWLKKMFKSFFSSGTQNSFPSIGLLGQVLLADFVRWDQTDVLADLQSNDKSFTVASRPSTFEYLACSPPLRLQYGRYLFRIQIEVLSGGLTIGFVGIPEGDWKATTNIFTVGEHYLELTPPFFGASYQLVLAACNLQGQAVTHARIKNLELWRDASLKNLFFAQAKKHTEQLKRHWRIRVLPAMLHKKLDALPYAHRLYPWARYRVTDVAEAGYAVRGLLSWRDRRGGRYLLSADVGDDCVSIIPVQHGRLGPRKRLRFTSRSAPMYLSSLEGSHGNQIPLVCLFNFDESHASTPESQVLALLDPLAFADCEAPVLAGHGAQALLSRPGHWGYRGLHVHQAGDCFQIAAPDRDKSTLVLLPGQVDETIWSGQAMHIDLGANTEPIGITALPLAGTQGGRLYCLSCRSREEVVTVAWDGTKATVDHLFVGGLSRSSVAAGNLLGDGRVYAAVALWGGDPKALNTPGRGEVVVLEQYKSGRLRVAFRFPAGMHPTDIACADLDGDGQDELIVLNYGVGLGPESRCHLGNVQIFKFRAGRFACVQTLSLPNPRIACVTDFENDRGRQLVISLFFERKLAIIKHI